MTLAGARCASGSCKCREPGRDDEETSPPGEGSKRFEIRLSAAGGTASLDLTNLGTVATAVAPEAEVCVYIDVPSGSTHDAVFNAKESTPGQGVAPRLSIAEYGAEGAVLVRYRSGLVCRARRPLRSRGRRPMGCRGATAKAGSPGPVWVSGGDAVGLGNFWWTSGARRGTVPRLQRAVHDGGQEVRHPIRPRVHRVSAQVTPPTRQDRHDDRHDDRQDDRKDRS